MKTQLNPDMNLPKVNAGSMLTQKTNEDFNKQQPRPGATTQIPPPQSDKPEVYSCKVHVKVRSDTPGKCPTCRVALTKKR